MSRLWIVAYDIADDRRRRQVAACLGTLAERVQESVFEGWLSMPEVRRLATTVAGLIEAETDTVRFYPMAATLPDRRISLGAMPAAAPTPSHWLF